MCHHYQAIWLIAHDATASHKNGLRNYLCVWSVACVECIHVWSGMHQAKKHSYVTAHNSSRDTYFVTWHTFHSYYNPDHVLVRAAFVSARGTHAELKLTSVLMTAILLTPSEYRLYMFCVRRHYKYMQCKIFLTKIRPVHVFTHVRCDRCRLCGLVQTQLSSDSNNDTRKELGRFNAHIYIKRHLRRETVEHSVRFKKAITICLSAVSTFPFTVFHSRHLTVRKWVSCLVT